MLILFKEEIYAEFQTTRTTTTKLYLLNTSLCVLVDFKKYRFHYVGHSCMATLIVSISSFLKRRWSSCAAFDIAHPFWLPAVSLSDQCVNDY